MKNNQDLRKLNYSESVDHRPPSVQIDQNCLKKRTTPHLLLFGYNYGQWRYLTFNKHGK